MNENTIIEENTTVEQAQPQENILEKVVAESDRAITMAESLADLSAMDRLFIHFC